MALSSTWLLLYGIGLPVQRVPAAVTRADSCVPVQQGGAANVRVALHHLVGDYRLIVVTDRRFGDDTVAEGQLSLFRTSSERRVTQIKAITVPAWGWSDIDLRRLGRVALAYPPSSRNTDRPGVEAEFDSVEQRLVLIFGNAVGRDLTVAEDAGVFFEIMDIDVRGIRGRWWDGGVRKPQPAGYFCAVRLTGG